ncbi:hypothetical protein PV762_27325 [Mitsuaria sp. CC2]|uniref:cation efflux protein, CzcI family n=1 Tax=Mitsuaria sp. CC2 TaxID=3029186 RepID=UPI003B8DB4CE
MRRWLSIFLLVLMPFQFTWGAAAAYCEHESSSEASHFGHHVHSHADAGQLAQGKKPLSGDKTKQGKVGLDNDCGTCHLSAAKPVSGSSMALADLSAHVMRGLSEQVFSTRAPDHPERPNWRIA